MTRHHLPLRHISIRVPWHDNGWNGTVCCEPSLNGACLRLRRIADNRDDEKEESVRGKAIKDLEEGQWPCCVAERGMFMAPFEYTRFANHPYKETSPDTHGHFAQTPLRHPPYSAPAVPFRWMFSESMQQYGYDCEIDVDPAREPELGFKTEWAQELTARDQPADDRRRPRSSLRWAARCS